MSEVIYHIIRNLLIPKSYYHQKIFSSGEYKSNWCLADYPLQTSPDSIWIEYWKNTHFDR